MKELLEYLLKGIINQEGYSVAEETTEGDGRVNFIISAPKEMVGLIIGKGGKTINTIRNLLKIRATLERKVVMVSIKELE